ncbi:hypothetical protein HanHA300_Chr03g0103271 [Helianthus annuus]|nr:hypothetical protein HanHA300_Chr03g0103271 [Helianthus annuus]
MVFPSPTSTRDGYGHINGVPVLHSQVASLGREIPPAVRGTVQLPLFFIKKKMIDFF